ncbi:MAG TPA: PilZ domain-containing protein [Ferrovibrio sp.]|uniref:PilZ domain-containing protein n=1 Tax=Ferrovibrio sp. TaxID=1917215 RepID=UPI002ECFE864
MKASRSKTSGKTTPGKKTKAAADTANRRRFQRRDTRIIARLEHGATETPGAVTNLSLQGCLFTPRVDLAAGTRIRLWLANETKPVAATVKAVSARGVHCLLHAGGATLSRLSADLDDMALLMLSAGRPRSNHLPGKPAAKKRKA